MTSPLPPLAYPGLPLGPSTSYAPGPGTHLQTSVSNGPSQITASLAGRPILTPAPKSSSKANSTASKSMPSISIPRLTPSPTHTQMPSANVSNTNTLPKVGTVVLAIVRRVRTRQVDVGILVVYELDGQGRIEMELEEGTVCAEEWPAVLRREDVRATEKEKVVCSEGFRVGDVIRGVVVSLGDQSNYYLTTAKNELGVIYANSEVGNMMFPISWKEFKDPETGLVESRKVAKPF